MNPETVLAVVALGSFALAMAERHFLRRALADARAQIAMFERETARHMKEDIETRGLISMVSDSVRESSALREEVIGLSSAARGQLGKFEAVLEYHGAEARNVLTAVAQQNQGNDRLVTVLNGQIAWLQRALYNDRSHERASENLEAERMVREADARDEAIASPMPYVGGVDLNGGSHQFSTQGRVPNPQDYEAPSMAREPEAVATTASPVPGTE